MKLKLKNDTIITVLESTEPTAIRAEFQNIMELDAFREELTKENLSLFQYLTEEEKVLGTYKDYSLQNTSYVVADGTYAATFSIRQLSDTEIRLDALEKEQETQNGAIDEQAGIIGGDE